MRFRSMWAHTSQTPRSMRHPWRRVFNDQRPWRTRNERGMAPAPRATVGQFLLPVAAKVATATFNRPVHEGVNTTADLALRMPLREAKAPRRHGFPSEEVVMKRATFVLAFLFLPPAFLPAQSAKDSWDNLKQLQPGQKIEVVDMKMKTLKGAFVAFTDETITLRDGGTEQSVAHADVVRVTVRDTSHRMRNMLLGSAIGGGIAIAATIVPIAASSNEGNSCGACVAAIAVGFGAGAALGAIPGSRTVYRTPKK